MNTQESREKDAQAVIKVLAGDRDAFAYLAEKYKRKIAGVCFNYLGGSEDIEGAVQETFLRAYKQLATLTAPAQFVSWLVRIARNLCIDKLRKRKEDLQSLENVTEKGIQVESPTSSPIKQIIEAEELDEFYQAFNSLDEIYREMLTLKNFCQLSYDEISQITGQKKSKIGELLFKARKQLRVKLESR